MQRRKFTLRPMKRLSKIESPIFFFFLCVLGFERQPHYKNTPIQIYRKFLLQKFKIFRHKNCDIFHISARNIDCGYSLEPPRRGARRF